MKEISKNSFYVLLSQIPSNLFGILVGIIITRILGAEGRGIYFIFQANSQFLVLLFGLSINAPITYFISNKQIPVSKIYGMIVCLISLALIGTILLLISAFYFAPDTIIPALYNSFWFLAYLGGFFVFQLIVTVCNGVLAGYKQFSLISKLTVVTSVINLVLFAGLYGYHWFFERVFLTEVFGISLLMQFLVMLIWVWKSSKYFVQCDFKFLSALRAFVRYAITGHLSNVINFFNYRFDLYVIAYFWDKAEVGYYSLSVSLAQFVWLVSNPLSSVLLPYISSSEEKDARAQIFKVYSKINFTLVVFGAAVLWIVSPVIPLIYGEEFGASILPFKVLLIGTFIASIAKPFSTYLAGVNLIKINLNATILGLIVTILLDFLLIPYFGIVGASVASLGTYLTIFLVVYISGIIKKEFYFVNYFFPLKKDLDRFLQLIKKE